MKNKYINSKNTIIQICLSAATYSMIFSSCNGLDKKSAEESSSFEKIDTALAKYYESLGRNDYHNSDNTGKFLEYTTKIETPPSKDGRIKS